MYDADEMQDILRDYAMYIINVDLGWYGALSAKPVKTLMHPGWVLAGCSHLHAFRILTNYWQLASIVGRCNAQRAFGFQSSGTVVRSQLCVCSLSAHHIMRHACMQDF